jgi:hypothetical protein
MNPLLSLLTGGKDYIGIVQEFIEKVFVHEARKYHCEKHDLSIVISRESDGSMLIMTYSKIENRVWRIIPDKEVQEILMK